MPKSIKYHYIKCIMSFNQESIGVIIYLNNQSIHTLIINLGSKCLRDVMQYTCELHFFLSCISLSKLLLKIEITKNKYC